MNAIRRARTDLVIEEDATRAETKASVPASQPRSGINTNEDRSEKGRPSRDVRAEKESGGKTREPVWRLLLATLRVKVPGSLDGKFGLLGRCHQGEMLSNLG